MIIHTRKDALLTKTVALPAAGKSAETEALDILQAGGLDNIAMVVEIPGLASLAEGKKASVKLQGSADGSTWTDVSGIGSVSVTGAAGGGAGAQEMRVRCPFDCPQFVKAVVSVDASGGDNTASSITFSVQV